MVMQNAVRDKLAASVAGFYEVAGSSFAATRQNAWSVWRLVTEAASSGSTVVDVGAGNGRLGRALPEDVRYVAVEPSATLRAAGQGLQAGRPNAEIRDGGFPHLPVADGEADVTACIAVLHHVPGHDAQREAVAELARITTSGGMCILTVWNLRHRRFLRAPTFLAAWLRLPMVTGGESGDVWMPWKAEGLSEQRYVHAFSRRELRSLFVGGGWVVERCGPWEDGKNLVIVARRA